VNQGRIAQALVNLDGWLETMRQPGGYGGPVAHWWQSRYLYVGPALDWRYEGILIGYLNLFRKTQDIIWHQRLTRAAQDVLEGQTAEGSYLASRFELNPGTLGTPHEAAATLGLLTVLECLTQREDVLAAARRNLEHLIKNLWDGKGFNDTPGRVARVPNKLATLAQSLMAFATLSGNERNQSYYHHYALAALEDVVKYQLHAGSLAGAIHQGIYLRQGNTWQGNGRFFPYYNARCIPPLVLAAQCFGKVQYLESAQAILAFIKKTMQPDGSWPQVVYTNGKRAVWPCWYAGVADILLAFVALGEPVPEVALERLLQSQLPSGAFPTAHGFSAQISQKLPLAEADYRDVTPVVGWNDKVFRLLSELLAEPSDLSALDLPTPKLAPTVLPVQVWGERAEYKENALEIQLRRDNTLLYHWRKTEPWARVYQMAVHIR
jgi:hypothetical protein